MTIAFETIRRCAEAHDAPEGMFHYTMSAAQNASETLQVASGDEWERLALASLESLLCDGINPETDGRARRYFSDMGVTY